jgi:hypothetical protein
MSHIDAKLQPFLAFDVPEDDAYFRLDISEIKWRLLVLSGLSGIAEGVSAGTAGGSGVPLSAGLDVTDAGIEAISVSTTARKCSIYNNGANDVIVLEGGAPGFDGQDAFTDDYGIVLATGDYFESPVAHKGEVNVRSRTGESGRITATVY